MAKDRYLIAPFETGLQTDIKPYMTPDEAWTSLYDAYVYKGRTRKRPGSQLQNQTVPLAVQQLYSRLAINLGATDGAGAFGPVNIPGNIAKAGQVFAVGNVIITVTALGAPATIIQIANPPAVVINLTVGGGAGNIITLIGAPINTAVWFYPAEPVMGIYQVPQAPILNSLVTAYDTQFAYQYVAGHWQILGVNPGPGSAGGINQPAGSAMWTGSDSQFIWATNWWTTNSSNTAIYATNNKVITPAALQAQRGTAYNGMKVYNLLTNTWANFQPQIDNVNAGSIISAALCMQVFKDCLFLFNVTVRTSPGGGGAGVDTAFPQTFYWNFQNSDPAAANSYNGQVHEGAGTLDIPTREAIVSVATIKDRLIIFCEESTWEVVYTGNNALLFQVQRINSELGCESTFSPTLFDRAVLSVCNFGITAMNGANVERIDEKIVNEVFLVRNASNGLIRTHGIRDYFTECVYWTFCNVDTVDAFPNQIILYNYRNGSFALLYDSITAFGYDNNQTSLRWQDMQIPWEDADRPWDDPSLQSQFTPVLAGNQQGVLFKFFRDMPTLAAAQYITNMDFTNPGFITITSINHNQARDDFIQINNAQGANLGTVNGTIFVVETFVDVNNYIVSYLTQGGETYVGGGTTQRVSQIYMESKQFNLYAKDGFNCRIEKLQFLVDAEDSVGAEIGVNYYCNTNADGLANYADSQQPNAAIQLNPYPTIPHENGASDLWRTVYTSVQGTFVQYTIYYTPDQLLNPNQAFADFQLSMVMIHATPTSARFS